MEKEQERVQNILKMFTYQQSIRAKGDKLRWQAMAFAKHRLPESMISDDSPVKPIHLYSDEGVKAIETFCTGFMGNIMSPNQEWFVARIESKDFEVVHEPDYGGPYTSYIRNAMKYEMNHSNFYEQESMATLDCITCGYSCTMFQNDGDNNRIFLKTFEPWNCWFDLDRFDTPYLFLYRYNLTGRELLDRFDILPADVVQAAKGALDTSSFMMLFAVIRRGKLRDSEGNILPFSRKLRKRMKFASYQILLGKDIILEESGYKSFPLAIHIWEKAGDSQYGRGLVMKYINEFSKLNRIAYEYGLSIAKINHQPWLVPDYMRNSFSDQPEARNVYNNAELIPRPLGEPIDFTAAAQNLALQIQNIKNLMYNDVFTYLSDQDKVFTATQVNAVKAEGLSKLAPIYANVQTQKIDPALKLVMSIMADNKRLKLDPKWLGKETNNRLAFRLDSWFSQMLMNYQNENVIQTILGDGAAWASMGFAKQFSDNVDIDHAIRADITKAGGESGYLVPVSIRDERRAREQQMAQEQLALENELKKSEALRNAAGAANLNNSVGFNGGMQ